LLPESPLAWQELLWSLSGRVRFAGLAQFGTLCPDPRRKDRIMGIRYRKRLSLGPLKFNITQRGLSSMSFKIGPWTWNSKTKKHSLNLPGGLSWYSNNK
jgi:hypothetical protein